MYCCPSRPTDGLKPLQGSVVVADPQPGRCPGLQYVSPSGGIDRRSGQGVCGASGWGRWQVSTRHCEPPLNRATVVGGVERSGGRTANDGRGIVMLLRCCDRPLSRREVENRTKKKNGPRTGEAIRHETQSRAVSGRLMQTTRSIYNKRNNARPGKVAAQYCPASGPVVPVAQDVSLVRPGAAILWASWSTLSA